MKKKIYIFEIIWSRTDIAPPHNKEVLYRVSSFWRQLKPEKKKLIDMLLKNAQAKELMGYKLVERHEIHNVRTKIKR